MSASAEATDSGLRRPDDTGGDGGTQVAVANSHAAAAVQARAVTSPTPTRRRMYTVPQAAVECALSARSIWTAIAAGRLKCLRFGKRATRIEASELTRFVDVARTAKGM